MSYPRHTGAWQQQLRQSLGWMLLIKFLALLALWAFFFSPAHRVDVDPDRVESRLLTDSGQERSDD
jgi:hypothetical protein